MMVTIIISIFRDKETDFLAEKVNRLSGEVGSEVGIL